MRELALGKHAHVFIQDVQEEFGPVIRGRSPNEVAMGQRRSAHRKLELN